jgi:hypothetical protein
MAHFLPADSYRHGYKFYELYACRACPAFVKQKRGYKVDRSREFITGYKVGYGHWYSVAVQTISKAVIYHGAGLQLRADARFDSRSFLWPPKRSEGGSEGWCPGATAITNLS